MTADQALIAIAASITAITVIAIGLRKFFGFIKKVVHFFDDWIGTEDSPGMLTRLNNIEQDVSEIKKEVTYNSGTSLKDAVRRIEGHQDGNHKRLLLIEDHLTRK
jgi:hypothetical protein